MLVGLGAIGRPLALNLAYLGMKRCVLVDRKRYKPQSRVSQCEPGEVGREKAIVVSELVRALGVDATGLAEDIEYLAPGYVEPETVVIVSADNRQADIAAGRLAAMMRQRCVKVNVAPEYLMASIRCYDLRSPEPPVCVECQIREEQYAEEPNPHSCEGGPEQATGSPRALCQFAANAAALVVAQLVASPDYWAPRWYGRQWQQMLLGGFGCMLTLAPKQNCRWEHARHWQNLRRLATGPAQTRLSDLAALAGTDGDRQMMRVRFSGRVASSGRCNRCHQDRHILRWLARLDEPVGKCACGGKLEAQPFFTYHDLPAQELQEVWNVPLADWGVAPLSVVCLENRGQAWSFVLGK